MGMHSKSLCGEASLLLLQSRAQTSQELGKHRADLGWRAVFLAANLSNIYLQVSFHSSSPRPQLSKHPVAFL